MYWPRFVALASDPRNGLTATRANQFVWGHIDFNLTGPITGDRNVRVALAYATNRGEIVGKLFHNVPIPAETDQNPVLSWAYTSQYVHRHFDPRRSRSILERDGWTPGPDGIRVKRGQRLEFTLSACSEYKGEVAIETLLQRDWQDVGAAANIKNYSHNLFFDNSSSGILSGGHYDVAIQSTTTGPDPDHSSLYSGDHFAPRGQNTLRWSNPSPHRPWRVRFRRSTCRHAGVNISSYSDCSLRTSRRSSSILFESRFYTTAIFAASAHRPSGRFGIPGTTRSKSLRLPR